MVIWFIPYLWFIWWILDNRKVSPIIYLKIKFYFNFIWKTKYTKKLIRDKKSKNKKEKKKKSTLAPLSRHCIV